MGSTTLGGTMDVPADMTRSTYFGHMAVFLDEGFTVQESHARLRDLYGAVGVSVGSADVGVSVVAEGVGQRRSQGSVDGPVVVGADVVGQKRSQGSVDGVVTVGTDVSGQRQTQGSVDGVITPVLVDAMAHRASYGTVDAGLDIVVSAEAAGQRAGVASVDIAVEVGAEGVGQRRSQGSVDGPVVVGADVVGQKRSQGSVDGVVTVYVEGAGQRVSVGSADVGIPQPGVDVSTNMHYGGVVDASISPPTVDVSGQRVSGGVVDAGIRQPSVEAAGVVIPRMAMEMEEDETMIVTANSTSVILEFELRNSVGQPTTGLAYNEVTVHYHRLGSGSTGTPVTLQSGVAGTWASGGFCEVDPTNMPGVYQLGVPNAALSAGARGVLFRIAGDGVWPRTVGVSLPACDVYDGVRAGLTALPGVAASAEGGLPVVDVDGAVAATLANPVALTSAYDAAKAAASSSEVSSLSSLVSSVQSQATDLQSAVADVLNEAHGANTGAAAAVAAIAELVDATADDVVAALLSEPVEDGQVLTVGDVLLRVLSYVSGDVVRTAPGNGTFVFEYRDQAGEALMTHVIATTGATRSVN